jgi:hypothetical protein
MKKFLYIAVCVISVSYSAFSADNSCLERASNHELLGEVSRRMGNGGGGGGDPQIIDAKVDLVCVASLARKHPYTPDVELLTSWAAQCRDMVDDRCLLLASSANTACVDDLSRRYPYSMSPEEVVKITNACRNQRFSCRL